MKNFNDLNEPLSPEYKNKIMQMASVELARNKKKRVFNWILIPAGVVTAALALVIVLKQPEPKAVNVAHESIEEITDLGEMDIIQNLDILEETL